MCLLYPVNGLKHRQFQEFLSELVCDYRDALYHMDQDSLSTCPIHRDCLWLEWSMTSPTYLRNMERHALCLFLELSCYKNVTYFSDNIQRNTLYRPSYKPNYSTIQDICTCMPSFLVLQIGNSFPNWNVKYELSQTFPECFSVSNLMYYPTSTKMFE